MPTPLYLIVLFLSALTFVLAVAYFIKVKTIYRWSKFTLAIGMAIVFVIYWIDGRFLEEYHDWIVCFLVLLCLTWIFTAWVKHSNEEVEHEILKYQVLQEIQKDIKSVE